MAKVSRISGLLNSETGKIVISIILGLGLATLFRKVCGESNCLVYKGVSNNEIKGKVFKFNDKCYSYNIKAVTCKDNGRILEIAS